MNYAVQHNLPIFKKKDVMPSNGKFYISAHIGFDSYLGCMGISPRRDFFVSVNGDRLGRLDYMDVIKKKAESLDNILIEVIPNKSGSIIDFSEFVPKMKSGYLTFRTSEVKMDFFDWIRFFNS